MNTIRSEIIVRPLTKREKSGCSNLTPCDTIIEISRSVPGRDYEWIVFNQAEAKEIIKKLRAHLKTKKSTAQ